MEKLPTLSNTAQLSIMRLVKVQQAAWHARGVGVGRSAGAGEKGVALEREHPTKQYGGRPDAHAGRAGAPVRQACPGACVTNLRTCIVSDFLVQNGMSMDEALKKAHELEAKEQHERVSDALCPTLLHAACWP